MMGTLRSIGRTLATPGRAAATLLALSTATVAPSVAHAQEPVLLATPPAPPDSVVLRNGGLLRGRIQEILPGDHLTIAMDGGELRRVSWAEVERVIVAASTKIPPMPRTTEIAGSVAAPPPPPPPPMRGPLVWVHITSAKHVTLNRRLEEGASWVKACESPCDVELPIADEYEIAGLGNGPTKEFHLQASPGQSVVLSIDPPSIGGIVLGGGLVLAGGVGMYISVVTGLLVAAACTDQSCGANPGWVGAGISAGALAAGGLILYLSAKTDINEHESTPQPAAPPRDAYLRLPTWRTPEPMPSNANAPAFVVPLFSRSF